MKKLYEVPSAEIIDLAAAERIAYIPDSKAARDAGDVILPGEGSVGGRGDY